MQQQNKTIKNRSEVLFLYDVTEANPNGDPDENKPRIDEDTDRCLVTDVRLKRTIRDFLKDYREKEIFVSRVDDEAVTSSKCLRGCLEETEPKNVGEGFEKFVMNKFVDVRLFGATIAVQEADKKEIIKKHPAFNQDSIVRTGPVQFKMGCTLHAVEPREIKGTSVFASREGNVQGTFREEHILPYGLIAFYGIVNENAAQHTGLSEEDIQTLQDGLWNGTLNLITRSKAGQIPRLLLRVEYSEGKFHIGGLDRMIALESIDGKDGRAIRSPKDYILDASVLIEKLKGKKGQIQRVIISEDADIQWKAGKLLKEQLKGVLGQDKIQEFDPNRETLKSKKV